MTNISFSLDWLRFTVPSGTLDNRSEPPSFIGGRTKDHKSILSYNTATGNDYHTVHWHTERPEFRVMVEITGKQLSALRKAGYSEHVILDKAIQIGARFTRIDFAVDLFDAGAEPIDVLQCWRHGQVLTVAQSVSLVQKETRKGRTGQTVYVGARSSERLVRVYDKGQETRTTLDWKRVELEAKSKRADQLGALMGSSGVKVAGLAMLADVVEWTDIDWFNGIWADDYEPFEIDSIGRPETDRERWLRTVVVPVIADELESGSEWLREALEAILDQNDNRHGPRIAPTRADD